jgi:GNAT superfamily N-acetyltransferase
MKLNGGHDISFHKNSPIFWKLVDGDVTVGTQSGHQTSTGEFRIRGLWISEPYRGKRLSNQLFDNAVQYATDLGCLVIWSFPRNSALPVYLKNGFKITKGPIVDLTEIHGPYFYVSREL